jgi:YggT family protein
MLKFADIFTSLIRSIFKPIFGIDLASLITAAALQAFCFYLISLNDAVLFSLGIMISWSLFSVLLIGLTVAWWALVGGVVISWVAPVSSFPPSRLLLQMSSQICKPFRLFLPLVGGLDFSPILAYIILQFLWSAVYGLSTSAGLPMHLSMGS